jgi:hypothetical protein
MNAGKFNFLSDAKRRSSSKSFHVKAHKYFSIAKVGKKAEEKKSICLIVLIVSAFAAAACEVKYCRSTQAMSG